ncbi:transporter [Paenibacillus swuensis]|uniref:Transporter n=1 Tax=Paenibacillus swuensis TaxID=1178515 RepID=A0A172TFE1_9BACL|nr:cation diffusion facilitator family transporter [Paenibacillus swuensis]ANE45597.1 transporter [Paenibacillus swuensis]
MGDMYSDIKKGEQGAWISIGAYIILSLFKVISGYIGNSEALVADGFNNMTDIVASVAVLIGLRISQKPPDRDHPYGHFRAETIAALVASFIMATVGFQVLITAIQSFFKDERQTPALFGVWVALISAVLMFGVYWFNRRLATKINNKALMAAAQDNRSDALVSIGAAIGIAGSSFGLWWLDPLAACLVGLIILNTAWGIFKETTHALTDGFDTDHLNDLRNTVKNTKGVKAIKDIRGRVHGNHVLVDVIIQVDPQLSLIRGHEISDEIEQQMLKKHNVMHVHVHVEPYITEEVQPGGGI